jgi:hypothetical protein
MNCLDMEITVQIVRFVDDHQPGWVECVFADAEEREHRFVDKVPIFSTECLDASSTYPRWGRAACEVVERWKDAHGRELVRVTTADGIESTEGLSVFVVLAAQLVT